MEYLAKAFSFLDRLLISDQRPILKLLFNADPVVKITILILIIFSIVCWGLIFSKRRELKKSKKTLSSFTKLFWRSSLIDEISLKRSQRKGPAFEIFDKTRTQLQNRPLPREDYIERRIRDSYQEQMDRIEYGMTFLSITASSAPFIGLFGTVWGILSAFWKIGQTGASSLTVVGPHIAEALIVTAMGLFAAIPAAIFYNLFVNRLRRIDRSLIDFTEGFITRIKQEYYKNDL